MSNPDENGDQGDGNTDNGDAGGEGNGGDDTGSGDTGDGDTGGGDVGGGDTDGGDTGGGDAGGGEIIENQIKMVRPISVPYKKEGFRIGKPSFYISMNLLNPPAALYLQM